MGGDRRTGGITMRAFWRGVTIALGLGLGVTAMLSITTPTAATTDAAVTRSASVSTERYDIRDDPRVRAFVDAYAALIDSVAYGEADVVFILGKEPIHFRDGRMLREGRLDRDDACDPIFYVYPLEPLTEPLSPPAEMPTYCTDVLESLWGDSETEIRDHGRSVTFLDHRMFVNELLVAPLANVEKDVLRAARNRPVVASWVEEMEITYSFSYREIAGSPTRSQHSFGLAVDFVPRSYGGRAVYWRWSRALDGEGWHSIPLDHRWSPPTAVIEAFERHGFVWGGKWAHFDAIHFEYRPEILLYSRLVAEEH